MKTLYKNIWISSLAMAFAGLGDTLLYLVLPIYGEEMGFNLFWIGVFLAINRLVRVPVYGIISYTLVSIGYKKSMIISSIMAILTTASYGYVTNIIIFLIARILWGLSFSLLRLSSLAYATQNTLHQGKMLGVSVGIKTLGAISAIYMGEILLKSVDVQYLFFIMSVASICALIFSIYLPEIEKDKIEVPVLQTLKLDSINQIAFITSFIVDGVLIVGLSKILPTSNIEVLMVTVGSYLIFKKTMYSLLAFVSGWISEKFGLYEVFMASIIGIICSMVFIAGGVAQIGIIIAFISNGLVSVLFPALALSQGNLNRLQAMGSVTTWWDLGAATGSLLGLLLIDTLQVSNLFWILFVLMIYTGIMTLHLYKRNKYYE